MAKTSAGIILYKTNDKGLLLFLVHPGGPYWVNKDEGAWSIAKGIADPDEDLLVAAIREFEEETGYRLEGDFIQLEPLKQPSRKVIHAWALAHDLEPTSIKSNLFLMEWPPKSGKYEEFPEVDRADWFSPEEALRKIHKGQRGFVEQIIHITGYEPSEDHHGSSSGKSRAGGYQKSLFDN